MSDDRTTDLTQIRGGARFTWGKPLELHDIGPYTVLLFNPWKVTDGMVLVGEPDTVVGVYGWVNGKSINESWHDVDSALVGLIAYRHGVRGAGQYIMRMLGAVEEGK